jgi:hypothetical protein
MRIYRAPDFDWPIEPEPRPNERLEHSVGLDLGQVSETTGLALLETDDEGRSCHVRQLRRYVPGTSYPDIASSVEDLLARPPIARSDEERPYRRAPQLVVGTTGVGLTVGRRFAPEQTETTYVTLSAGDAEVRAGDTVRVPKREIIGALQSALQEKRLTIAAQLPDAAALVEELQGYRLRVRLGDDGDDWRRAGARADDLIHALGLAYWRLSVARPFEWWMAVAPWGAR